MLNNEKDIDLEKESEERIMTSAIHDMSVADVRKALALMRKEWYKHSSVQPFFPSKLLTDKLTMADFAFKFVMGHHEKRHQKNVVS